MKIMSFQPVSDINLARHGHKTFNTFAMTTSLTGSNSAVGSAGIKLNAPFVSKNMERLL